MITRSSLNVVRNYVKSTDTILQKDKGQQGALSVWSSECVLRTSKGKINRKGTQYERPWMSKMIYRDKQTGQAKTKIPIPKGKCTSRI